MIHASLLAKYLRLKEAVYKKHSKFHHVEYLEGPQILVLSPHPDDDVLGCGGTLIRHIQQGHQVAILYLCQGDKGIAGLRPAKAAIIRKKEAVLAAQALGIAERHLHFLAQPDDGLYVSPQTVLYLKGLLDALRPDLIYLPSFVDNHPDHFQTNLLLKAALTRPVLLSAYEVWTPLVPNRIVDISGEIEQKRDAIRAHQSQLQALDYLEAIAGLNRYRGGMYPKKPMQYAEAFCFARSSAYFGLFS